MSPFLLRQKAAAAELGVSVRYLRYSDAPRVLLPSNRPGGHPLLRYDRELLIEWARHHLAMKVHAA